MKASVPRRRVDGRTPFKVRFWANVDIHAESGCWEWTGDHHNLGYGILRRKMNGVMIRLAAHRFAYEHIVGPIPEGLELDHLCRNPSCVNPDHLEPVTHRENILRGTAPAALHAKKTHCPRGHPYDEANTVLQKTPHGVGRVCRACRRDGWIALYAKKVGRPVRRDRRTAMRTPNAGVGANAPG